MESLAVTTEDDWGIVNSFSEKQKAAGYRFYPDQVKGEGFFIAAFRKKTAAHTFTYRKNAGITKPAKQELEQLLSFVPLSEGYQIFKQADQFRAIPSKWVDDMAMLAGSLYIKKAGIEIGAIKGKDIVPSHELAMSVLPKDIFNCIDVTLEQALQYLRRHDLVLEGNKGWNLIMYEDIPLGWAKVLPNRINNYYPQEWRIRNK